MNFEFNHWVKLTLEVLSPLSVVGAIMAIVPPATAIIGLVYWSVMLYRLLKKKAQ